MQAQEVSVTVFEGSRSMSRGTENAFAITLDDVPYKMVKKVWKDYVRSHFRSGLKYDRREKEYLAKDARVRQLTKFPVHLISVLDDAGKDVHFTLWVDLRGAYVESQRDPRMAEEVRFILQDFAVAVERAKIEERLEEEEKELRHLERDKRRLESAQERYHREIAAAEALIERMKENIITNKNEQEETEEEIQRQLDVVEEVRRLLLTAGQ